MRSLSDIDINYLEHQGCSSNDWSLIKVSSKLDIKKIQNVRFDGYINLHEGVEIRNVPGGISNCTIKENVSIINVASIEFDLDSTYGVGTPVSVLDETGSRKVFIYPGLSSQMATLMAREPQWLQENSKNVKDFIDSRVTSNEIGENTIIKNCGSIKNVSIGRDLIIDGTSRLENGSIINNAEKGKCFTYIGHGVEAKNFIVEDGRVESKSSITNCYIGQGAVISHGFSAHDSLFFANCAMENGESHSLLAGPYTVSMHKGTLLIGCQTSFLNAGSSTNQSNHMYKLGPLHWGVLERGVKTSSGSYLMLGAKIGAFSLLMGFHKTHPDSSVFPFSYLFGDERGSTIVVPALMLRSCGLLRDEMKWPARDKRIDRGLPLYDHITFSVLNPFTVETMLKALETIEKILLLPTDDDLYIHYKGMKFTRGALERAKNLYTLAIYKYLSLKLSDMKFPEAKPSDIKEWTDLGGEIIPRIILEKALQCDNIPDIENLFSEVDINYTQLELQWIGGHFGEEWRKGEDKIASYADEFDSMIEEDRQQYLQMLEDENEMLSL